MCDARCMLRRTTKLANLQSHDDEHCDSEDVGPHEKNGCFNGLWLKIERYVVKLCVCVLREREL